MATCPMATFSIDGDPEVIVINVRGEIDASNASAFAAVIEPFIVAKRLVIDCTRLRYIGSAGLTLLVRIADDRRASGSDPCVLRGAPDRLQRLLGLIVVTPSFDMELLEPIALAN